jgi:hypothetical protein
MIFVEKENTHDKKSNLIYYVTENNELYYANANQEDKKALLPGQLCKIYEQSTKDYKYRTIDNRIVLIGQPIEITNENNENIWTMPAVIKRPGFLGKLFRPDLYIIEYRTISEGDITNDPEPIFKLPSFTKSKMQVIFESDDDEPSSRRFVITKKGEGHRTKVTKIGLSTTSNGTYLVSGSEWPTVKRYNIFDDKTILPAKNAYLADVITNRDKSLEVTYDVKKDSFSKNKFKINNIDLPYLPNIIFDPDLLDDNITERSNRKIIFESSLTDHKESIYDFSISPSSMKNSIYYCSLHYRFALVLKSVQNEKKWHIYYKKIPSFQEPQVGKVDFLPFEKTPPSKDIISTTAFDFKNRVLFYATYDQMKKETTINKKDLSSILASEESESLLPLQQQSEKLNETEEKVIIEE